MLIRWSGIGVVGGSGKLGGTVVGGGKAGNFARILVKPVNPNTNSQISRRAKLSTRSQAWRGLTAAQRSAWNAAAASGAFPLTNRLGKTFNPTGAQLYNQLNLNIVTAGGTAITDPPIKPSLTQILVTGLTGADAVPALSMTFTGTLGANEKLFVFLTPNISPGISRPGASKFRLSEVYSGASPADILSGFQALYGDPVSGQKIFVKAIIVDSTTGVTAQAGSASAIVAA